MVTKLNALNFALLPPKNNIDALETNLIGTFKMEERSLLLTQVNRSGLCTATDLIYQSCLVMSIVVEGEQSINIVHTQCKIGHSFSKIFTK